MRAIPILVVVIVQLQRALVLAGGPGNYGHYTLPSTPEGASDMSVTHIWTALPGADEVNGNAVFAAT